MIKNLRTAIHKPEFQTALLVLLRVAIGWHFMREGAVKLLHPSWTASGYLYGSWGPFAPLFHHMGGILLGIADVLIPWLLFLAGLGLLLGLFTRSSALIAMLLLAVFYAATPPFNFAPGIQGTDWPGFFSNMQHAQWAGKHAVGAEGNYIFVNKNLVEFLALAAILAADTGKHCGLDVLLRRQGNGNQNTERMQSCS